MVNYVLYITYFHLFLLYVIYFAPGAICGLHTLYDAMVNAKIHLIVAK